MEIQIKVGKLEKDKEGCLCLVRHEDKVYNIGSASSIKLLDHYKEGDEVQFYVGEDGEWCNLLCPHCYGYCGHNTVPHIKHQSIIELPEILNDKHPAATMIEVIDEFGRKLPNIKSINTRTLMAICYVKVNDVKEKGSTEEIQYRHVTFRLKPNTV